MKYFVSFTCTLLLSSLCLAGDAGKTTITPPEEDRWIFLLSMPGWAPSLTGDTGINGLISQIDLDPGDLIRHYDMVASLRFEASKGRFGIMGDLLYTSLSDGIGTETVVKKIDIQVDQTIAELALRWRVIDQPRGSLDVYAGVRYTNLFQQVVTQPNEDQIDAATQALGEEFSQRVNERIDQVLSEERLRTALLTAIKERISNALDGITGPNPPEQTLPNGPLAGPKLRQLGPDIDNLVQRKAREVIRATAADAKAAAEAEAEALRATTGAARAEARKRAARLRATVNERVSQARSDIQNEVKEKLNDTLDASVSRTDDWWDPFIGIRARYNFTDRCYLTAKGDLGGFGVGSEFTWQAEAALGYQFANNFYTELGYRAFGVDYEDNGLTYDVTMHGAQLTMGIEF